MKLPTSVSVCSIQTALESSSSKKYWGSEVLKYKSTHYSSVLLFELHAFSYIYLFFSFIFIYLFGRHVSRPCFQLSRCPSLSLSQWCLTLKLLLTRITNRLKISLAFFPQNLTPQLKFLTGHLIVLCFSISLAVQNS